MNKRYALCVGNNYPGTGAELRGCVNDAEDWEALLTKEGYQVSVLAEAGKASTLERLSELVARAGWGDRVVFTFSGHGTWVPDHDGDEADGRDEALVMAGLTSEDLLRDDELQTVFSNLKYGTGALILSDSCHSGTISKFADLTDSRAGTPKFISPINFEFDLSYERTLELEARAPSQPRRISSLISGCADLEYSYDAIFAGRPNGAFTRAAIDSFMSGITMNHWHQGIRFVLPSARYPQTPQMSPSSAYRKYTRAL